MDLSIDKVFEQQRIDTRNLTNKINDNTDNINIALAKTRELTMSMTSSTTKCLTVCEINQIIADYVDNLDVYLAAVDQSTLGELIYTVTDPAVPPIVVDLCPHVAYCESDTVLSKVTGELQLSYVAEKHTNLVDLSDWFVASNIAWSGTATGLPNSTTQDMIDEIVLGINDVIDCTYFTGVGTPAFNLNLDDLADVNTSGTSLNFGDFIMYDGNNWVPNSGSSSFSCSSISPCALTDIGDVTTGASSGDVLLYDGANWNPVAAETLNAVTYLDDSDNKTDWTPTAAAQSVSNTFTVDNTISNTPTTFFLTASCSINAEFDPTSGGRIQIKGTVFFAGDVPPYARTQTVDLSIPAVAAATGDNTRMQGFIIPYNAAKLVAANTVVNGTFLIESVIYDANNVSIDVTNIAISSYAVE